MISQSELFIWVVKEVKAIDSYVEAQSNSEGGANAKVLRAESRRNQFNES